MAFLQTIYQRLNHTLNGWNTGEFTTNVKVTDYATPGGDSDEVIIRTGDREELMRAELAARQDKYLANKWYSGGMQVNINTMNNASLVDLMYRDVELMSTRPEISAALDLYMAETCNTGKDGNILNIYSKSPRIKSLLEDLFVNRLQVHLTLPHITRTMCKYGNAYQHLNLNSKNGIVSWRELPTAEIKRFESQFPYGFASPQMNEKNPEDLAPHFEWLGAGTQMKFRQMEISHFRMLHDSFHKPYGTSLLNGARRHARLLGIMEDAMLIYRTEKAFERRVFKIDVASINPDDVPAFIQEIANKFKRTIVVDPKTGQIDLKKNILAATDDIFIPVRPNTTGTTIETMAAGNNLDKIEDLQYVHTQMLSALRIPKPFLGFTDEKGNGKNLSNLDTIFNKLIIQIQQALIMELNKTAIIHLYLLGFEDDLNNFTITMNNPSTQQEILRIEEMSKKVLLMKDVIADSGNGIPIMSYRYALKNIMKLTEEEISEILNDIRLEKAISAELVFTPQIISRTGVFDRVDKLFGAQGAEYHGIENYGLEGIEGSPGGGGMGGGGMLGGDDFGSPEGDVEGEEGGGGLPEGDLNTQDNGQDIQGESQSSPLGENKTQDSLDRLNESLLKKQKKLKTHLEDKNSSFLNVYTKHLMEGKGDDIETKISGLPEDFDNSVFFNKDMKKLEEAINSFLANDIW
jgi:hypothetical protein